MELSNAAEEHWSDGALDVGSSLLSFNCLASLVLLLDV